LQAPGEIAIDRCTWSGQLVNHSIGYSIHINIRYLRCNILLLLLMLVCLYVLHITMNYDHSQFMIELNK
jgi:hypothetical protein